MTPDQYHERARAQFDVMRTREKDRILWYLIEALYPSGNPNQPINAEKFVAEAVELLAAFHPDQLKLPDDQTEPKAEEYVPEF